MAENFEMAHLKIVRDNHDRQIAELNEKIDDLIEALSMIASDEVEDARQFAANTLRAHSRYSNELGEPK